MKKFNDFLANFLLNNNVDVSGKKNKLVEEFVLNEDNISTFNLIEFNQKLLLKRFMNKVQIFDIINQHWPIPNATVGKSYKYKLDLIKLGNNSIVYTEIDGLEGTGLTYNNETEIISGTPIISGDYKINLLFKVKENEDEINKKPMTLIINADPKSLWKNIPSDLDKDEEWRIKNHWKEDNVNEYSTLGEKNIVVASKRGRSHANVGSFRDDDYSFKYLNETKWSIVCVADGAGSAKLSRQGSKIACKEVISFMEQELNHDNAIQIDFLINKNNELTEKELNTSEEEKGALKKELEDNQKELTLYLYNHLGKAAFHVHKKLEEFALLNEVNLKDLHSTLIFTLFKKYEFGYAFMTFGVGDCPIGIMNKDGSEIKLMNWLDVGEFGGGTRFITMPEIFSSDKFQTRFGFKLMKDFSYLFLMTDGIYDPKFVVESNLEKIEKWNEFIDDLKGNNDDKVAVDFGHNNNEISKQLSDWMDFWSPGNHDDRTLAIVF